VIASFFKCLNGARGRIGPSGAGFSERKIDCDAFHRVRVNAKCPSARGPQPRPHFAAVRWLLQLKCHFKQTWRPLQHRARSHSRRL